MEEKKTSGAGYLFQLAGNSKWLLLLSAIFSVVGTLCSFVPYVMVYRVLMFLFAGGADFSVALGYGITAAIAIGGKFFVCAHLGRLFPHRGLQHPVQRAGRHQPPHRHGKPGLFHKQYLGRN
ncbi:hypothetical protein LJB76_00725 [Clostridia bacterium OttesenSCG-928-O13]|nr:hypothetical protein [Clostridia bacterium OttesenSCG-928-O13]